MVFQRLIAMIKGYASPPLPDDLTKQQVRKATLNIAGPAITELLLVQLCSMINVMMVSRLGPWAIASVGYSIQPQFLLLSAFIALNSGSTALIARAKGSGNSSEANTVLVQCISLSIILSVFIAFLGYTFAGPLILFMGANTEQTIQNGTIYMKIQMIGLVFTCITMSITAALRGVGKTKMSMVYNLSANITNVIVNWLLIYGNLGFPALGVTGSGIASVTAQIVACSIAMYIIIRGDGFLQLRLLRLFHFKFPVIKRVARIGLPAMFEQLVMRLGMLIYVLTVTSLGTELYATHQIASSILAMSFMNGQAFGISAAALLGQSLGRKRIDHAKAYTGQCRIYSLYITAVLFVVFFFFGGQILSLFTDDPFIIREGAALMKVVAFLQPFQTTQLVTSGALRGAGDTKYVAIFTFVGIILIRPVASQVLIHVLGLGLIGAWLAMGIDQGFRSLLTSIRFHREQWAKIKV